ncbi:MAG: AarF/UbiB family protein, partial [Syntrophomonadaceae bacterium]|nr:AarF/UbiB family protein [Syntrophomonadaceae bacterium]
VIDLIKIFTDWERFVDMDVIYEDFHNTLQAELDYIQEGRNAEQIAQNNKDNDLLLPNIFWEFTRKRVLTMEYMEGMKINDYQALREAGTDFESIARKLLQTYVRQVLVDGFFHADPHPGNLFVTKQGQLVMVDFGMVGSIPPELRKQLVEMVFAMVRRDYQEVVAYLKEVGFLRYDANSEVVTRAVALFIDQALGREDTPSSLDISAFLDDLEVLLYEQPFQIPANFTFLGRALGTLYGLCISLDPRINFLEVAKPYLDEIGPDKKGIWDIIKDKTTLLGTSFLELPPLMVRVLSRAERGELKVKIPIKSLNQAINENTRAIRIQAWAICLGCSLLSTAYLYSKQLWDASRYCLILTVVFFLFMILGGRKTRKRRAPHPPVLVNRTKK